MAADATIETLQIEIETASSKAADNINALVNALKELKKVSQNTSGLSDVSKQLNNMKNAGERAKSSLGGFKKLFSAIGFRQITKYLGGAVNSVNEYVENVNLFQVSMGKFYDEAASYADLVSDRLGVDPSQWMRTQGVFMSMGKGFGMAEEQAYNLSESLTELSYDISSLYNEDIESAATRLQSALAGEIEPIRRLGISISQATLQEYALSKGIKESVASMTEQEKALLRSLKLIEGASDIGAIGDFAKTLESPANAMRVLSQQITQFKRAIGSVLLPAIIQILPYIQALTSLLTDLISRLAVFAGFEMPEWETSAWETSFGGATDAVDDTTAAVKKLKNATIGLDELNIISPDSGGAGAAGGISDWAKDLEVPDLWNKDAIAAIQTQASKLKEKLEPILALALKIGAAMLAIKIADSLFMSLDKLQTFLSGLGGASKGRTITIGMALAVTGLVLEWDAIVDAWKNGLDWTNLAQITIGEGGVVTGGYMIGKALGNGIRGGAIAGIIAFAPALGLAIWDAVKNGLNDKNAAAIALSGVGLGASIGALFGPGGAIAGAFLGGAAGLMIDLGFQFAEDWDEIKQGFVNSAASIPQEWENLCNAVIDVQEWFSGKFSKPWNDFWHGVAEVAQNVLNDLIYIFESTINVIIDALNLLSFDVPDWVPGIGGKHFGFNFEHVVLDRVDFFANGGFPDVGQMFVAREAGPELVGTIGNRTAVANNNQIIAGIEEAAYRGFMRALSEQGGNGDPVVVENRVYLDGKQIRASFKKADREAGASISSGGVLGR